MWRFSEKDESEKEEEEVTRLVRKSPKKKPPRKDKERGRIEQDDPDLDQDDKDLSMNYKDIGGSIASLFSKEGLRGIVAEYRGLPGPLSDDDPYKPPQPEPEVPMSSMELDLDDYEVIVKEAISWLEKPVIENYLIEDNPDMAFRVAMDYSIYNSNNQIYRGMIDAPTYERLVGILKNIIKK